MNKFKLDIRSSYVFMAPVALFVILGFILSTISPIESGAWGILLVLVVIYAFILSIMIMLTYASTKIVRLIFKRRAVVNVVRFYYLASVLAFWPLFLLAFNTLGQLDVTEVVLVTLLVGIGSLYVLKR